MLNILFDQSVAFCVFLKNLFIVLDCSLKMAVFYIFNAWFFAGLSQSRKVLYDYTH